MKTLIDSLKGAVLGIVCGGGCGVILISIVQGLGL